MDVLTSETCWALNNDIIKQSDIKLVSLYSTIKMMHVPINIRLSIQFTQNNTSVFEIVRKTRRCGKRVDRLTLSQVVHSAVLQGFKYFLFLLKIMHWTKAHGPFLFFFKSRQSELRICPPAAFMPYVCMYSEGNHISLQTLWDRK